MKYLDTVIKETLRMYPITFAVGRLTETDIQIGKLRNAVSGSKMIHSSRGNKTLTQQNKYSQQYSINYL
jgi:cytochrome P450